MSIGRGPNFDYKYGVFARVKRKEWDTHQLKMYFDKHGYPYNNSWNKNEFVEELKKWER